MRVAFYNDLPCKNLQPIQESALDTKILKIYKKFFASIYATTLALHI